MPNTCRFHKEEVVTILNKKVWKWILKVMPFLHTFSIERVLILIVQRRMQAHKKILPRICMEFRIIPFLLFACFLRDRVLFKVLSENLEKSFVTPRMQKTLVQRGREYENCEKWEDNNSSRVEWIFKMSRLFSIWIPKTLWLRRGNLKVCFTNVCSSKKKLSNISNCLTF